MHVTMHCARSGRATSKNVFRKEIKTKRPANGFMPITAIQFAPPGRNSTIYQSASEHSRLDVVTNKAIEGCHRYLYVARGLTPGLDFSARQKLKSSQKAVSPRMELSGQADTPHTQMQVASNASRLAHREDFVGVRFVFDCANATVRQCQF